MKQFIKAQYVCHIFPCIFCKGNIVLMFNTNKQNKLGPSKFVLMKKGPYIINQWLHKRAYVLFLPEGGLINNLVNMLYLKEFFP